MAIFVSKENIEVLLQLMGPPLVSGSLALQDSRQSSLRASP